MSAVIIVPYCPNWPLQFEQVRAELLAAFAELPVDIVHTGSTSVPGLASKPVIDVLLGADSLELIESRISELVGAGYQYIAKYEHELPNRRYFVKAQSHDRLRVHLHAVVRDSAFWRDHIAFANALRADATLLADYQSLKMALAAQFANDKSAYTDAKTPFVLSVLKTRLQCFCNQDQTGQKSL
jgi:GrpB-like predicted nucleotidyltransferase (UPF0157 family)